MLAKKFGAAGGVGSSGNQGQAENPGCERGRVKERRNIGGYLLGKNCSKTCPGRIGKLTFLI